MNSSNVIRQVWWRGPICRKISEDLSLPLDGGCANELICRKSARDSQRDIAGLRCSHFVSLSNVRFGCLQKKSYMFLWDLRTRCAGEETQRVNRMLLSGNARKPKVGANFVPALRKKFSRLILID